MINAKEALRLSSATKPDVHSIEYYLEHLEGMIRAACVWRQFCIHSTILQKIDIDQVKTIFTNKGFDVTASELTLTISWEPDQE